MNYDLKYHPMDDVTAPTRANKRKVAHAITTVENSNSDIDDDSEIYDEDVSGTFRRGARRKRRSTSSTMSTRSKRIRNDYGHGLRTSTIKDISRIAERYVEAWETSVEDLTPSEAFEFRATQYTNAWENWATQAEPQPLDEDEDDELGDIDFDHEPAQGNNDELENNADINQPTLQKNGPTSRVSLQASQASTQARPRRPESQTTQLNVFLNEELFAASTQSSRHSSSQDSISVAESLQNQVCSLLQPDGRLRRVYMVPAPKSNATPAVSPAPTPKQVRTPAGSSRKKKSDPPIAVYEDHTKITADEQWANRNLRFRMALGEDPKENDEDDLTSLQAPGFGLDGNSSPVHWPDEPQASAIGAQKSFNQVPTLRQEIERRTTNEETRALTINADNHDDDDDETIRDGSDEEEEGPEEESDSEDDDNDDARKSIKSEPLSSSAR